jgi:predicted hydrocarbon binding protein
MKNMNDLYPTHPRTRKDVVGGLGVEFGRELAISLGAEKDDRFKMNLAEFWASNGLGRMRFEPKSLRIAITNCYDCVGWELAPKILPCTFKRTLLETVLSEGLKRRIRLVETRCCRTGGGSCVFEDRADAVKGNQQG